MPAKKKDDSAADVKTPLTDKLEEKAQSVNRKKTTAAIESKKRKKVKDTAMDTYNASSIEVLEGLDPVRKRPGMYIGSTGTQGLHHILWEIVDNAVDEAANGFARNVNVRLLRDGSASVKDDGRGIPVDIHEEKKKRGVELVFTVLHAGGKFNNKNYTTSGGLHGVGASVTNALSRWLRAVIHKDGYKHTFKFHTVTDADGKMYPGIPDGEMKRERADKELHGTEVTFMPDERVFDDIIFDVETVRKRLKELAFLNRGITFTLTDERDGTDETFCYEGGITDYVASLVEDREVLFKNLIKIPSVKSSKKKTDTVTEPVLTRPEVPVYLSGEAGREDNIMRAEIALTYVNEYGERLYSFVNNIHTVDGGTHETGFRSGLTKALNEYARSSGILKDKDDNLAGEDYREGLVAVISVKLSKVQFEGQTKAKLGNAEAKKLMDELVYEKMLQFLSNKSNKMLADSIVRKALEAQKLRMKISKEKELAKMSGALDTAPNLVGKLSSCTGRDTSINELYLVEGDSAGGSAKQARDRRFQAILPLKGKPLNCEKKTLMTVLENEEMRSIISAIGTNLGSTFDITKRKYDKIIILSDADQDGAHIRAILLAFFFRYMPELITEGHVYIGMPPLYKVYKKDWVRYCYDDKELAEAMKEAGKTASLQRYKGLGEMNPQQLWDTTLDPKKRSLIQVTLSDAMKADEITSVLMGGDSEPRKKYIMQYADFGKNNDEAVNKYNKG